LRLRHPTGVAGRRAEAMVGVMDPPVSGSALAALGEDLFLLSIRRRDGKLLTRGRIDSALMASELIRLAAAGQAWIAEGRIVATDQTATGDPELDAALLSLAGATTPPRPETWVGLPRRGIRAAYAARLTSAGALRMEPGRVLGIRRFHVGTPRYRVTDAPRVAAARSRLDAVTQPPGAPAAGPQPSAPLTAGSRDSGPQLPPLRSDPAQPALAGLASAIGLGDVLYPGREGRAQRARMAQIARQQVITNVAAGAASPLAIEGVIAAIVHALTAVIEDGSIVTSEVVGTRVGGIHIPGGQDGAGHSGGERHAGTQGDSDHAGDFGHH
jgi:hypothetical protein